MGTKTRHAGTDFISGEREVSGYVALRRYSASGTWAPSGPFLTDPSGFSGNQGSPSSRGTTTARSGCAGGIAPAGIPTRGTTVMPRSRMPIPSGIPRSGTRIFWRRSRTGFAYGVRRENGSCCATVPPGGRTNSCGNPCPPTRSSLVCSAMRNVTSSR